MSVSIGLQSAEAWTPELLIRLDWQRFVDLVRLIIAKGGYQPRSIATRIDGLGMLSIAAPRTKKPEGLAGCAPWDRPIVDVALMKIFIRELDRGKFATGVFFTPGGFVDDVARLAEKRSVELVDGRGLLRVISRLPSEDQVRLLQLSTAGHYDVPTCPKCSGGMYSFDPGGFDEISDRILSGEQTIVDFLRCAQLTIARKAEAHFLGGVFAENIVIEGRAVGNFSCAGTVTIESHGSLTGTVKSRSLALRPGGTLDGDLIILKGKRLEAPGTPPELMRWRCPRCRLTWPTRELAARGLPS